MKVAIASDHRGYHLKEKVISLLKAKGHEVDRRRPVERRKRRLSRFRRARGQARSAAATSTAAS